MPRILGAALLLSLGVVSGAARADDNPTVGQTVYSTVREPDGYNPAGFPAPLLERELVRQAFLLAARDELGLATRDVLFREDFPKQPDDKSQPFELVCRTSRGKKDFDVAYVLRRRQGTEHQTLWTWTYNTDINNPKSLEMLAEKAGALSRGELKDVLTRAGWGRTPPPARASADVSSETRELLWSWNEISVLAGLRRVHAEIREKGESPELLGALTIGYANLGTLTEYHFSAGWKACYARALLYAERLLRKTDESPSALWHRAYVRTQVGLHNFAANDIAAAKKKQGAATPEKSLPFWTSVIDAFTQGELPRMVKDAKTDSQRRLARYLDLQAVLFGQLGDVKIKAAHALLEVCPDCPRAYDALVTSNVLGAEREGAYGPFRNTAAFLRRRLVDVPGLPEAVKKRLNSADDASDDASEINFRKELVADLNRAGAADRDPVEPSLSALAHLIDEIDFAQVLRRLEFEAHSLGVPTDETVATFAPLCTNHPYGAYIRGFSRSKADREAAATELLAKLDCPSFTFKMSPVMAWLHGMTPAARLNEWYQVPGLHSDMVFSDEMRGIGFGQAGQPDERKYNRPYMMKCWNTSNKLPLAVAMRISRDWAHARLETDVRERDYADDPIVMNALSNRYYSLKRYDDAERCAKLHVRYAPSYAAYRLLANVYEAKQDHVHWKETLEKGLDLPAEGLEHAQIRNDIALDLMKRKQWAEAVVYADSAAESYSEWSMVTAARCHEMLGHWKKSEELVHAISERYENAMYAWIKWCHRTGHGDVPAADEFTRTRIEALGTSLVGAQYRSIGMYYLLTREPDKALLLFQRAYETGHSPFAGFHAALAADALGKTAERDALLQQVVETKLPESYETHGDHYQHLAARFQEMLPPKEAKLDRAEVDKILAAAAPQPLYRSTLPYFVGVFLKNRGDLEGAKAFLIRCAQADDWQSDNHVLACQLLRDMKVAVPPAEQTESKTKQAAKVPADKQPEAK
jgi:tetratricopeptide (TPR) repeat protein